MYYFDEDDEVFSLYRDGKFLKTYKNAKMVKHKNYVVVIDEQLDHDFYDENNLLFSLQHNKWYNKGSTLTFFEYENDTYFLFTVNPAILEIRNMKNELIIGYKFDKSYIQKIFVPDPNIIVIESFIWHPIFLVDCIYINDIMTNKEKCTKHNIYYQWGPTCYNIRLKIKNNKFVYSMDARNKETHGHIHYKEKIKITENIEKIKKLAEKIDKMYEENSELSYSDTDSCSD